MNYYEDEHSKMWVENGIVYQFYKAELILDLAIAKKMVAARLSISNGIIRPVFVDIRNIVSLDSATRKYFAGGEAVELISAGALYLDNCLARMAGNIFLKIDKPVVPTRLFTNKEKALQWLEVFKYLN